MAALAGVVHNRQGAAGDDHNRGEDNQQGGLHCDLANAGPPSLPVAEFNATLNEHPVNTPCNWHGEARLRCSHGTAPFAGADEDFLNVRLSLASYAIMRRARPLYVADCLANKHIC
jgi:hypothetical protein